MFDTWKQEWDFFQKIADALNALDSYYNAGPVQAGGGIICLHTQVSETVYLWWGTANENWGYDFYDNGEFVDYDTPGQRDIPVRSDETDIDKIVSVMHATLMEMQEAEGFHA